jgi:biopolymer transport protein ExbB/TolQ
MDTLIQADIFFFITTIAVIIFTILVSIAMYYLIGALKNFKRITKNLEHRIDQVGDQISDEAEYLKNRVHDSFIFNLIFAKKKAKSNSKK